MSFHYSGMNNSNSGGGGSAQRYDKHLEHQDQTPLGKLQHQYWTTKQKVLKKLGKNEDEYVVLSDAELDAKLDLFRSVKQNSNDLLRIIDHYQEKICELSMVEAEMSGFLKEYSQYDKTRAGKMMASVSKAQNLSSQQRMSLRVPLTRFYNEVETFRYRAITDTWLTIRKMEQNRAEYRGALLWMKDVSSELDPDTHKKLEKFRRVQSQVKLTKVKFDKNKVDVQQKIDLLLASRCNMFSNVLFNYQQCLINYWQKTSKTMNAIADAFKGYQYYEFNIIKDLIEPSRKLAGIQSDSPSSQPNSNNNKPNEVDEKTNECSTSLQDDIKSQNTNTLIQFDEVAESKPVIADTSDRLIDINDQTSTSSVYTEDNINDMIDQFTKNEANSLSEQLKELETLQKVKLQLDKQNQMQSKQQQELINTDENCDENLIRNLITNSNDEFEKEWQAVFGGGGSTKPIEQQKLTASLSSLTLNSNVIMPSQLLLNPTQSNVEQSKTPVKQPDQPSTANNKKAKKDMSSWYDLFADIDPLQNPDAIGNKKEVEEERNC